MRPGDHVTYCGPTDGHYFPAEEIGVVLTAAHGAGRAAVKFAWGVHYLKAEYLRVVSVQLEEAA